MSPLDATEEITTEREGATERSVSNDPSTTRRALFAALTGGALLGTAAVSKAQATGPKLKPGGLRLRMLRRISYGPIQEEVALASKLGYDAYLDSQLNYEAIDDSECEAAASYFSTINFSERDLFKVREDVAKDDLADATIIRALMSKRQLYQRMVEFWTDHFNVFYDKVGVLKVVHDRDVIRRFALGNFPQMLMANTMSPATLVYLDNDPSSKESPNQNLAREMMELHSIGVNGGYTQEDVINVARCLTGWTVRLWPQYATDIGKFVYDKTKHYNGIKVVLGKTIPSGGGITDGQTVVRLLADRRAAGKYLGTKLCRYFLGYDPGPDLLERLGDIYVNTNGEIKPMVREVLSQENMMASQLMVKRPFHYTMGLLRQSQAELDYVWPVRDALYTMGQHPFEWAPPNGYPLAQPYWATGLLPRWNFSFRLFAKELDYIHINRSSLMRKNTTVVDVLARINTLFFHGEMGTTLKDALTPILNTDDTAISHSMYACALATTAPGYQLC